MDCSAPGFLVLHCLPEFVQTHVHQVDDAIQPSHPLLLPSPPPLPSVFPSIRVRCVCVFQKRVEPMSWLLASGGQTIEVLASGIILPMNIQLISFRIDWFDLFAV